MVSPTNIKITSYNNSQNNNTNTKTNLNTNINIIYKLYYPQNDEERWIISQIKKLYSKLLIAHFNILKINANLRKELYEELLIKYKNFFGKDFIPENNIGNNTEDNIEDNTGNENNNYNFDDNPDKENKRITIKNSIQSYVEDSSDEEAYCYHCDGEIELKDTEMCECFGHPYCCDECSVAPPDENDCNRYCSLCVPLQEIEINSDTNKENNTEHETKHDTENIEPYILSDNSKKEDTEKELRKILGIKLKTDSIPIESPPPYNEQNSNSYLNNPFIAKEA